MLVVALPVEQLGEVCERPAASSVLARLQDFGFKHQVPLLTYPVRCRNIQKVVKTTLQVLRVAHTSRHANLQPVVANQRD